MRDRIVRLRRESIESKPRISPERALLVTEYYRNHGKDAESVPVFRAKVLRHIMSQKRLHIGDDELLVGDKGPGPKEVPTYPELCCHSMDDLEILDSREKIPYSVDDGTRNIYREEIIPFWTGKSIRDIIINHMSDEWRSAYSSGVFTEFMEQRSPGHTVAGSKVFRMGMVDYRSEIASAMDRLDPGDSSGREELRAMDICAQALIVLASRYAQLAESMAMRTEKTGRREELLEIARICRRVPAHAPSTFREALQHYWFIHLGVTLELNPWDSFSPGKLDQNLLPFYTGDLESGVLSEEDARELLQCFWIKFNNQPAPPKVGVTAMESSTYTDFAQINTGGLSPSGLSGVSDLSYLVIDVAQEMRLLQPSLSVQIGKVTENGFLERALEMVKAGFGQPSIFNADMIVRELMNQGKTMEDALLGGSSGCVEVGVFGMENYNLSGYFNLPKILEITLISGNDPVKDLMIGAITPDPAEFTSTLDLINAFGQQVRHFADIKINGNDAIEEIYSRHMPAPFLSLLIDDCIKRAKDYHSGGARYNTTYIQCVGLGTLVDSISAVEHHVFGQCAISMEDLMDGLSTDFVSSAVLRGKLRNQTPRYGNDDKRADRFVPVVQDILLDAIDGRANGRGGRYHINFLPTTVHVYFGSVTGATPDGRHSGTPLSEGISPVQGMDRNGPTAVVRSAAMLDHSRTGGTLLNQKFIPAMLETEKSRKKLAAMIRTYFQLGGHHIQMNVVDRETLLKAREDPDSHRNLIVRVAGYSDYFCDLSRQLQDEIIARTGHGS